MKTSLLLMSGLLALAAMPAPAQTTDQLAEELRRAVANSERNTAEAVERGTTELRQMLAKIDDKLDTLSHRLGDVEEKADLLEERLDRNAVPQKVAASLTPAKASTVAYTPPIVPTVEYTALGCGDAGAAMAGPFSNASGCGFSAPFVSAYSSGCSSPSFVSQNTGCGYSGYSSGCSYGAQNSGCSYRASSSGCSYGASSGCSTAGSYRNQRVGPLRRLFGRSSGC